MYYYPSPRGKVKVIFSHLQNSNFRGAYKSLVTAITLHLNWGGVKIFSLRKSRFGAAQNRESTNASFLIAYRIDRDAHSLSFWQIYDYVVCSVCINNYVREGK